MSDFPPQPGPQGIGVEQLADLCPSHPAVPAAQHCLLPDHQPLHQLVG